MTDETILAKAIEKAEKNGFKPKIFTKYNAHEIPVAYSVLYDREFAKAFWGEENGSPCFKSEPCDCDGWHEDKDRPHSEGYYPQWSYRLTTMVLQEEPIKYIEKFL